MRGPLVADPYELFLKSQATQVVKFTELSRPGCGTSEGAEGCVDANTMAKKAKDTSPKLIVKQSLHPVYVALEYLYDYETSTTQGSHAV